MKKIAIKEIMSLSILLGVTISCLLLSGCGELYGTIGHRPVQVWHESKSYNTAKARPFKCWFVSCPEYTKQLESEEIQGS